MPGWYTDTTILQTFPSAAGLTADQLVRASEDSQYLYAHAQANSGISDADLRGWAMAQGITTDRINAALALLVDAGQMVSLPAAPAPVSGAESQAAPSELPFRGAPGTPMIPAESLTRGELRAVAARLGVEVKASATKTELIDAIEAAAAR